MTTGASGPTRAGMSGHPQYGGPMPKKGFNLDQMYGLLENPMFQFAMGLLEQGGPQQFEPSLGQAVARASTRAIGQGNQLRDFKLTKEIQDTNKRLMQAQTKYYGAKAKTESTPEPEQFGFAGTSMQAQARYRSATLSLSSASSGHRDGGIRCAKNSR